jgi:hypothetical protein
MKQKITLGNKVTIAENLATAKCLLAEMGYLIFTPGGSYTVRQGFIAVLPRAILHAKVVRVLSRGSFLEAKFSSVLFSNHVAARLRKNLSVPVHISIVELPLEDDLRAYIHADEHDELQQLLKNPRL